MKYFFLFLLFIKCFALYSAMAVLDNPAFASDPARDKIKAVFLYRFFDYITWPAEHGSRKICTIGEPGVLGTLQLIQQKQAAAGNKLELQSLKSPQEAKSCSIIFADADQSAQLTAFSAPATLTISDSEGFAKQGGMIEMVDGSEELGLIINLKKIKEAQMEASSRLLEIAEVMR